MSKLISGKEALIALANGEEVEYLNSEKEWVDIKDLPIWWLCVENTGHAIRLKPRTITINGIECPEPFEPKDGDTVYYLDGGYQSGYTCLCNSSINAGPYMLVFWRTEEEIKQVVAALRQVFKGEQA